MQQTSQIVIVFDREMLKHFRAECIRRDTTPTEELRRFMKERLGEWTQSTQGDPNGRHRRQ